MHFLIIGAGGIGCYYGAKLQNTGHSITYLARGEHLAAMQQHGLQIVHEDFNFHESVDAVDTQQLLSTTTCDQFDMIILTTKSNATPAILEELKAWLEKADTPLLSLQNGVDNEALIAEALGEKRTYGGLAIRIGGHIVSPGKVEVIGPAQVVMGFWPNSEPHTDSEENTIENIAKAFSKANIPTRVSPNIQHELWRKLIINNGVNPLSALSGLDSKTLTSHPILTKAVYQMMEEVASVAKADNIELTKDDIDEMYAVICNLDAIKTSMLVDKEKGRPLELDSISGAILSRAEKLGIETPITALVHSLLLLEEK